jgi:transcriptional regulator with XRE-family HTH domain
MSSFGEKLRAMRDARKLSQDGLAKALGIHQTTVSGIELNERMPSPELVVSISRFFDVPLEELLEPEAWATSRTMARNARAAEAA